MRSSRILPLAAVVVRTNAGLPALRGTLQPLEAARRTLAAGRLLRRELDGDVPLPHEPDP